MIKLNHTLLAALAAMLMLPFHAANADNDYLWNCEISIENMSNTDTLYFGETMVKPNTTGSALLELERHLDGEVTFEGPSQLELKLDDGSFQTIANVNYTPVELCTCIFRVELTEAADFSGNLDEVTKISVLSNHVESAVCDGED